MAEPPSTPSRHEKSLGLLTIKFVNLLQEAQDGVLDLKVVSVVKFHIVWEVTDMKTKLSLLSNNGHGKMRMFGYADVRVFEVVKCGC